MIAYIFFFSFRIYYVYFLFIFIHLKVLQIVEQFIDVFVIAESCLKAAKTCAHCGEFQVLQNFLFKTNDYLLITLSLKVYQILIVFQTTCKVIQKFAGRINLSSSICV